MKTAPHRPRPAAAPAIVLLTTALAATLLLTGCASAPPVSTPDAGLAVPEAWAAAASPAPPADAWWRQLGDPALPALVAEALEHNRDLAAAAARVDAAAAQAVIAGADLAPQAAARLDASRRRQNFLGFPIPGGEDRVLSTTNTSLQASLDVSWEVDLWGRLHAQGGAALARAQASEADLAAARLSLAARTAHAWFAVREADEQESLARRTVDNRRSGEARIRRRYENGLATALELRQASAARAEAEALWAQRRRQRDAAGRALELLLGRYPDGVLQSAAPAELPDASLHPGPKADATPPPVPAGVPASLLARRPDLVAAERRLTAAGLELEAAHAALLPRITLTGSAGRSSQELVDLLDPDFSVWSLAAGVLQPILQGGRLRAAVDLAEAQRREALESYAAAALTAFSEVEDALAAEGFLADRAAALEEAARQSRAARDLAEERYLSGLTGYLTVLDGQRQALSSESALLAVRRERLDARVTLHLALGGGFGGATAGTVAEAASPTAPEDVSPGDPTR